MTQTLLMITIFLVQLVFSPAFARAEERYRTNYDAVICFNDAKIAEAVRNQAGYVDDLSIPHITSVEVMPLYEIKHSPDYKYFIAPKAGESPEAYTSRIARRFTFYVPNTADRLSFDLSSIPTVLKNYSLVTGKETYPQLPDPLCAATTVAFRLVVVDQNRIKSRKTYIDQRLVNHPSHSEMSRVLFHFYQIAGGRPDSYIHKLIISNPNLKVADYMDDSRYEKWQLGAWKGQTYIGQVIDGSYYKMWHHLQSALKKYPAQPGNQAVMDDINMVLKDIEMRRTYFGKAPWYKPGKWEEGRTEKNPAFEKSPCVGRSRYFEYLYDFENLNNPQGLGYRYDECLTFLKMVIEGSGEEITYPSYDKDKKEPLRTVYAFNPNPVQKRRLQEASVPQVQQLLNGTLSYEKQVKDFLVQGALGIFDGEAWPKIVAAPGPSMNIKNEIHSLVYQDLESIVVSVADYGKYYFDLYAPVDKLYKNYELDFPIP